MHDAASRLFFVIDSLTQQSDWKVKRYVSGAIHKCRRPSSDMLVSDATQGPGAAGGDIPYLKSNL